MGWQLPLCQRVRRNLKNICPLFMVTQNSVNQIINLNFFSRLKPLYTICRSYGTFFPNKYSFVGSFHITGLKPVVSICRSYGTFLGKGDNDSPAFLSPG
jgi:hypothetical protein